MERRDVIVIGGGPAGSSSAIFLAKKGYRPLVLEREEFPRFHVGESLVPASQEIWDRMGLADVLQHSRYEYKYAATIHVAANPASRRENTMRVSFTNVPRGVMPFRPFAYQVERSKFDRQLLEHAVSCGAELRKANVTRVIFDGDRATGVEVRAADGGLERIDADFIVDASGRRALIANQLGLIEEDPVIKTSACFGHFENVARPLGAGHFEAYLIENGWVWFIPFVDNRMSFGFIQNKPQNEAWTNNPEENLLAVINRYSWLRERFTEARQVSRTRMLRNLCYQSRRMAGDGWALAGDAFFFIDPLFSTGVHVALNSGEKVAEAADAFLKSGRDLRVIQKLDRRFLRYRDFAMSFIRAVYRLLRNWWTVNLVLWWCGRMRNNNNTYLLRRLVYWVSGNYESYQWTMRWTILQMNALALLARAGTALAGHGTWKPYRDHPCLDPPLHIPRMVEGETEPEPAEPEPVGART